MKSLSIITSGLLALVIGTMGGCSDKALNSPMAGLGSVTVTKYVAIGNSLTAGYQSNGWYESAQVYSFPNLIAQQLKVAGANIGQFEQPLWSDPGTPGPDNVHASRYEILSLTGPVIGPNPAEFAGSPKNTALARPYDNLGIPGIVLYSFLDSTNITNNPLVPAVLRSTPAGPFPKTIFAQTMLLRPDLVTFWLGNNDVLGYATSGGTFPSSPTNATLFGQLYAQAIGTLHQALPNTRIVVANIPDVRSVPFFTTAGPEVAANIPQGVYVRYQKHGNTSVAFDSTRFTEANAPLLTLKAIAFVGYLGRPSGAWYRANGITPAAGIDTTKPFGFHPQNPLPDALVLDADEQATAGAAVSAFNASIAAVAAANGAIVVDINGFLASVKANGYSTGGQEFTADYVSGGLFSLDGVHPSTRGAGIIANQFIKAMNSGFGMSVPYVDVSTLPGIPAPVGKLSATRLPVFSPDAFKELERLWSYGY